MASSESTVVIRPAEPGDSEVIARLLHAAFAEFRPLYTAEGFDATATSPATVAARMRQGPVWVAEIDRVVVGTVSAVAKGDALYIRGMAVDPPARGRQIAEELLNIVEEFALREGFASLSLSTTPFLDSAIRLYERSGFKRPDTGPFDLHGTPLFTMEKRLRAK